METWPRKDLGMSRTALSTVNCFDPNGSFYSRLVAAAISDKIFNMGLTLAPGVKSLLSMGPGVQETDDAKEAAQCLSTRRQSILQSSVWHLRLR